NTSLIKNFQEVGVAAASLSKQVFLGNARTIETQWMSIAGMPAHFVIGLFSSEPLGAGWHDNRRDFLLAGSFVHSGHCGGGDMGSDIGSGVGDEFLGSVDDPIAIFKLCLGQGR